MCCRSPLNAGRVVSRVGSCICGVPLFISLQVGSTHRYCYARSQLAFFFASVRARTHAQRDSYSNGEPMASCFPQHVVSRHNTLCRDPTPKMSSNPFQLLPCMFFFSICSTHCKTTIFFSNLLVKPKKKNL